MGAAISYMGTKRELAGDVAQAIASCRAGPMLDAFSGMCSVGEAVGMARQVWVNDAQVFACEVGKALFLSRAVPLNGLSLADRYHAAFKAQVESSSESLLNALEAEEQLLQAETFDDFEVSRLRLQHELRQFTMSAPPKANNLFTAQYADTFIGLRQALEIDAIVKTIGWMGSSFDRDEQRRWSIIALGRALLRVSNSTGHFAQYLKPKFSTFKIFQRQRRRSIWSEWLSSQDGMEPIGDVEWRQNNRAFNTDALTLLEELRLSSMGPSVIYADPPYTNDHYSRYYHIFETLALYDYPTMAGVGRYRSDRFTTSFCLKSKAAASIVSLAQAARHLGADLVLSYPTNGLAHRSGFDPEDVLRRVYGRVETHRAIAHDHSTLGASKGVAKAQVIEKIYMARV